jgi:hypothetical protein
MEILLLAVVIGLIPAAIAHNKGGNFFLWWFFGAALWIVAFPISLFMARDQNALDQRKLKGGDMKRCPQCVTVINAQARVCPQCHSDLTAPAAFIEGGKGQTVPLQYGDVAVYEVVGESHAQSELESLAGGRSEQGARKAVQVILRPETGNPHDDKAVRVESEGGALLGYLARPDARRCRQDIGKLGSGIAAVRVNGVITGGWSDEDGDGHFGLELRLTDPPQLA